MSKIDFTKPIQYRHGCGGGWYNCKYVGPHPERDNMHIVWDDGLYTHPASNLRNKTEKITTKEMFNRLWFKAQEEGMGWATQQQLASMLYEKLVDKGLIQEGTHDVTP